MRFSVVIPSYLGHYKGAASRREEKIVRAINSVLDQTFTDLEVQVVADGCQRTIDICKGINDERLQATLIKKAPLWDGKPRNTGIEKASGEYIVYLDIDDAYGEDHLKRINEGVEGVDWVYYNDYIYRAGEWIERHCDIKKIGMNGTSNVCHKRELGARWGHRGYAHDHYFNQKLLMFRNFKKITTPEYFVMHMPAIYDI